MALFGPLYDKAIRWAHHRHALRFLALLSFAESSFFPIPPDVMLAPMSLAKRHNAWRYAAYTTLFSVLGGIFGYVIGTFAFNLIEPALHTFGYWERYLSVRDWFTTYGVWIVFIAGFSPIPYKIFTITAGVIGMAFLPFVIASAIGRGARFFLVSAVIFYGGEKMETLLRRYVEYLGWLVVAAGIILYLALK